MIGKGKFSSFADKVVAKAQEEAKILKLKEETPEKVVKVKKPKKTKKTK
jgi:hypothetical protein